MLEGQIVLFYKNIAKKKKNTPPQKIKNLPMPLKMTNILLIKKK